jgi:hypothetical protein
MTFSRSPTLPLPARAHKVRSSPATKDPRFFATLALWTAAQTPLRERALTKLNHLWDNTESKVFRFAQFGHWRPGDTDRPELRHGQRASAERRPADFQRR